jgi:hypothetical protein
MKSLDRFVWIVTQGIATGILFGLWQESFLAGSWMFNFCMFFFALKNLRQGMEG